MIREADWAQEPVIVTVAPTGAEVTRAQNTALPHTPTEIAQEVVSSCEAGASVAHLHAREPDGTPSARPELFIEAIDLIRTRCDAITMVSTGGAVGMSLAERAAGLAGRPDMAGIEVGSINYGDEVFATPPPLTRSLAAMAVDQGIALEVEAFEVSHVEAAIALVDAGVLPRPLRFNLVFGVPGGLAPTLRNLMSLVQAVPADSTWSVTVVGRHQFRLLGLSVLMGATGVRVGFEDNTYLAKGRPASSNAELVARIRDFALSQGRAVADPDTARSRLGLGD
jgi:3-keto-5-aminohexanoate cleavage enzyme